MVIKPASEMGGIGTANLPYEKRTHYMEKYVPYTNAPASTSVKVKQKYEAPTEKFAAESTYQKNYTGKATSRKLCYIQSPTQTKRRDRTELNCAVASITSRPRPKPVIRSPPILRTANCNRTKIDRQC